MLLFGIYMFYLRWQRGEDAKLRDSVERRMRERESSSSYGGGRDVEMQSMIAPKSRAAFGGGFGSGSSCVGSSARSAAYAPSKTDDDDGFSDVPLSGEDEIRGPAYSPTKQSQLAAQRGDLASI